MAVKKTAKKAAKKTAKKSVKRATKKTAKKVASKTAASKAAALMGPDPVNQNQTPINANPFLLSEALLDLDKDPGVYNQRTEEFLTAKRNKRKNKPTQFSTMSEVRKDMLPLREFTLQWLIGSYGIPHATILDIVGPEGIGKTSLIFYIIGGAIMSGSPVYYQETEAKPMKKERVLRMLSNDPNRAVQMLKRIHVEKIYSLRASREYLKDWVDVQRNDIGIPLHIPLVVAIDTWSKLMGDQMARGFYDMGDNLSEANKKKHKDIGEGNKLDHAAFAQAWCTELPYWLEKNNVIILLAEHQNDKKLDFGASKAPAIAADVSEKFNKNKRGGRAFNQNTALQFIITRAGIAKFPDKTKSGTLVNCRVDKNSYGTGNRELKFELRTEHRYDTDDFLEDAFIFHDILGKLLLEHKMFGLTCTRNAYTSEELGVYGVSASELHKTFHSNHEAVRLAGKVLGIDGYFDLIDQIRETKENKEELIRQEAERAAASAKAAAEADKVAAALEKEENTPPPPPPDEVPSEPKSSPPDTIQQLELVEDIPGYSKDVKSKLTEDNG